MASERIKAFLAEWVGSWALGLLCRSLRVRIVGDEILEDLERRHGPICFCSWHALLLVPLYHHRFNDGVVVVSEHADGELIARVLRQWGYGLIRGSTTHGGVRALVQAVRAVRAGHGIGITPDGPLGPLGVDVAHGHHPGLGYLLQPTEVLLSNPTCPDEANPHNHRSSSRIRSPTMSNQPTPFTLTSAP